MSPYWLRLNRTHRCLRLSFRYECHLIWLHRSSCGFRFNSLAYRVITYLRFIFYLRDPCETRVLIYSCWFFTLVYFISFIRRIHGNTILIESSFCGGIHSLAGFFCYVCEQNPSKLLPRWPRSIHFWRLVLLVSTLPLFP
jgi:hypothetical protein